MSRLTRTSLWSQSSHEERFSRPRDSDLQFIEKRNVAPRPALISTHNYNPHLHKGRDLTTTKTWKACILAANMVLTTTLFEIPYMFKKCGLVLAIIVAVIVLLFCMYGYLSLVSILQFIETKVQILYFLNHKYFSSV